MSAVSHVYRESNKRLVRIPVLKTLHLKPQCHICILDILPTAVSGLLSGEGGRRDPAALDPWMRFGIDWWESWL